VKYCCFCGKVLGLKILLDKSTERYCSDCDHVFFDTPSPVVIISVTNMDRVLLTRSVGWKHPYWGLIAGHVKSGETAEEAATREVYEEVGLEIFDLNLIKTYAVKTRNLLMISFMAKTKSVGINKSEELENAAWFKLYEPLPLRPNSIASHVIRQSSIR
jgi:NAD+ diphosphatase